MVNMTEPRIAEKYSYETNSMSVSAGHFLLKLVGFFILYMVGVGLWWVS